MGHPCPAEGCPGTREHGRCVTCEVIAIRLRRTPWDYPNAKIKPLPSGPETEAAYWRELSERRDYEPEGASLTSTVPRGTGGMGLPAPVGAGVVPAASQEASSTRRHVPEGASLTTTDPGGTCGMGQEAPVDAFQSPSTPENSFSRSLRSRSLAGNPVLSQTSTRVTSPTSGQFSSSSGPRFRNGTRRGKPKAQKILTFWNVCRVHDMLTVDLFLGSHVTDEARIFLESKKEAMTREAELTADLAFLNKFMEDRWNAAEVRANELCKDFAPSRQKVENLERQLERMANDATAHAASEENLRLEVQQLRQQLPAIQRLSLSNAQVEIASFRATEAPTEVTASLENDVVRNGASKRKRTSDNDGIDGSLIAQSAKRQRTDRAAVIDPSMTTQSPSPMHSEMP